MFDIPIAGIMCALPVLFLTIIFLMFFDVTLKYRRQDNTADIPLEPDLEELEQELDKLIKNNQLSFNNELLKEDLQNTVSHTVASYMTINKKSLKGFHFFQLIFSLIKNGAEDSKIIKIMRHYLPESPTAHLYTLLKSCKEFLNITRKDGKEKELLRDLNQNRLRSTLIYLQNKLNQTLNRVSHVPPALQQPIIDEAARLGLIFASFAQFYDRTATEKILRLAAKISPELYNYWHQTPQEAHHLPQTLHRLPRRL